MCRAVWVVVVGASEETCKLLRRAAGPEAQVVDMLTDAAAVRALSAPADVFVIDGSMPDARAIVEDVRTGRPDAAVVWAGDDAPEQAHQGLALNEGLNDVLPGAITKALIARRTAGRTT